MHSNGNQLQLGFVTHGPYSTNIGSRLFLMEDTSTYKLFKLKNREFTFTADVSQLPCGLNGALYFVAMAADGGASQYPGDGAGAEYGTGNPVLYLCSKPTLSDGCACTHPTGADGQATVTRSAPTTSSSSMARQTCLTGPSRPMTRIAGRACMALAALKWTYGGTLSLSHTLSPSLCFSLSLSLTGSLCRCLCLSLPLSVTVTVSDSACLCLSFFTCQRSLKYRYRYSILHLSLVLLFAMFLYVR